MASFTLEREVAASPETVFDVLTDHRGYAEITPMRKAELEREGEPAPNGVGAIRVLRSVGPPLREEVIGFERPGRFSYRMLSGAPVRDHVGTVSLEPAGAGTKVTYAVHTTPTVPVAGAAVVAVVKLAIKQLLNGIVAESERRAAAANG
jgi:uncharacterized protein YndB with AHSA1/START domain